MSPEYSNEILKLREQLASDAEKARLSEFPQQSQLWVDPKKWSMYTGPGGRKLYRSFSDEELLDIIRREAETLGHIPAQREVFCVYRDYIRRRFGNWIRALWASGLREPRHKKQTKEI